MNADNIRDVFGGFIGLKIVDISQHDKSEWEEEGKVYIHLLFDNGWTLQFNLNDGSVTSEGPTFND